MHKLIKNSACGHACASVQAKATTNFLSFKLRNALQIPGNSSVWFHNMLSNVCYYWEQQTIVMIYDRNDASAVDSLYCCRIKTSFCLYWSPEDSSICDRTCERIIRSYSCIRYMWKEASGLARVLCIEPTETAAFADYDLKAKCKFELWKKKYYLKGIFMFVALIRLQCKQCRQVILIRINSARMYEGTARVHPSQSKTAKRSGIVYNFEKSEGQALPFSKLDSEGQPGQINNSSGYVPVRMPTAVPNSRNNLTMQKCIVPQSPKQPRLLSLPQGPVVVA